MSVAFICLYNMFINQFVSFVQYVYQFPWLSYYTGWMSFVMSDWTRVTISVMQLVVCNYFETRLDDLGLLLQITYEKYCWHTLVYWPLNTWKFGKILTAIVPVDNIMLFVYMFIVYVKVIHMTNSKSDPFHIWCLLVLWDFASSHWPFCMMSSYE